MSKKTTKKFITKLLTPLTAVAVIGLSVFIGFHAHSASASIGGLYGWEGYGWRASNRVSADFIVPQLSGTNGAVAFWVGFGQGNPGIQQTGITGNKSGSRITWNAWYEMWPSPGHGFGKTIKTGDKLQFIVTRSGYTYTLTVNDSTQRWTASTRQYSRNVEPGGEAVAEAFGSPLPNFSPARFQYTNGPISNSWKFPFGGTRLVKTGSTSFYIRH